jgi:hypothetical protein
LLTAKAVLTGSDKSEATRVKVWTFIYTQNKKSVNIMQSRIYAKISFQLTMDNGPRAILKPFLGFKNAKLQF